MGKVSQQARIYVESQFDQTIDIKCAWFRGEHNELPAAYRLETNPLMCRVELRPKRSLW
jgi:hypothetical protein